MDVAIDQEEGWEALRLIRMGRFVRYLRIVASDRRPTGLRALLADPGLASRIAEFAKRLK